MDFKDVTVERIDILSSAKFYSDKIRGSAKEKMTEEQMKFYDTGVKNVMNVLEMLIDDNPDEKKNRLIYQKYGKPTNVREFMKLSDVLKEAEMW